MMWMEHLNRWAFLDICTRITRRGWSPSKGKRAAVNFFFNLPVWANFYGITDLST